MVREIYTGLNYPVQDALDLNPPTCSTSECTWPLFDTLEVCAKTWNVTKHLTVTESSRGINNFSLSNGAFLHANTDPYSSMAWLLNGYPSLSWASPDLNATAVSNFFVVYYDPTYTEPSAVEVLLHMCVRTYNISMSENVISKKQVAVSTETVDGEAKIRMLGDTTVNVTSIVAPGRSDTNFPFGLMGFYLMQRAAQVMLNGTSFSYYATGMSDMGSAPARVESFLQEGFEMKDEHRVVEDPVMGVVTNMSRNIAASLSNG